MSTNTTTAPPDQVDVRGPRFAAWVTTVVIVATVIAAAVSSTAAAGVLGVQPVRFVHGGEPGGPGSRVRDRRGARASSPPVRPDLPALLGSPSSPRPREGVRAAAEV